MREIKFRAWDRDNAEMVYSTGQTLCGVVMDIDGTLHCPDSYYRGCEKDYTLLQYTGLKDENGVVICEGDIVDADHVRSPYRGNEVIEWHSRGIWTFRGRSYTLDSFDMKVIGNIYENPELLK